jgi:hypothetical protein
MGSPKSWCWMVDFPWTLSPGLADGHFLAAPSQSHPSVHKNDPYVLLSILISSSYKDINQIGLGPSVSLILT